MGKRVDEARVSPFDALRIARLAKVVPDVQMVKQSDSQIEKQPDVPLTGLAKSRDPRYVKFTTYIPRDMHLRAKSRLVSQGRELSDLVAELLDGWLAKQVDG
ncbi:MAG TPA: hypothetical protein VGM51_03745 [Armatimonadota bacterium]|jgi:hypothetical protein